MTPEQAKTVADFLLPQMELEIGTTAKVLAAVPDDRKDYTPHEVCMNAGALAQHLALGDLWFLDCVINGHTLAMPDPTEKPAAELAADYTANAKERIETIRGLPGEHLAKDFQFFTWTVPCITILQLMQKHSVHHRGQLSVYLRPMGAKVPAIYGGSADEPMS